MRHPLFASFLLLAQLAMIAGCAAKGPFPSLAPRAVEKELADADAAQPLAAIIADDPAVVSRVEALLAEAKRGQAEFDSAFDATARTIQSSGAAGSETWVAAQEALSRLEAAQGRTARALGDLDAFGLTQANGNKPTSEADLARIETGIAQAQAMADAQRERVATLRSRLSPL